MSRLLCWLGLHRWTPVMRWYDKINVWVRTGLRRCDRCGITRTTE